MNGGPGTRWATQGAGWRGLARVGVERVADSGVVAAPSAAALGSAIRSVADSGVVAILGSGALRRWGLWQFPRLSRCGIWGYGNRAGAPTARSSRRVALLGVVAAPFLPQPQFPQRAKRENCHNPRIGNGAESKQRGRKSATRSEGGNMVEKRRQDWTAVSVRYHQGRSPRSEVDVMEKKRGRRTHPSDLEVSGSPGRIRTYDTLINSQLRYHCATGEWVRVCTREEYTDVRRRRKRESRISLLSRRRDALARIHPSLDVTQLWRGGRPRCRFGGCGNFPSRGVARIGVVAEIGLP